MTEKQATVAGALARFDSPASLMEAAKKMHDAGYTQFDCHSPFPIHGMDKAMGLRRSPLGWIVGIVALLTLTTITLIIWWITSIDYPMVISGKPFFSYQAYVPVMFALTILSAALTALFGMMALNRLPQLHHPLFESEQFGKVTDDGFFVSVNAGDPKFDRDRTPDFLKSIGGNSVEVVQPK